MKHTIKNLAVSNLKKEKSSSILVIVSIVMTTLLLSLIMSMGYGAVKSGRANAGILYGDYYGTFRGVNDDNLKEMMMRSEFTDIGKMGMLGFMDSEKDMSLYFTDETLRKMMLIDDRLAEGSFPEGDNEIAAEPSFFLQLGLKEPKIGDKVTISYRKNLKEAFGEETFVISGLLKDSAKENLSESFAGYISEACYKSRVMAEEQNYNAYFKLNDSLDITSDSAEEYIKNLGEKCGIDRDYASGNDSYLYYKLDPGYETLLGCFMVSLLVIFFSEIVIYNIFQVGIIRKVQEYGKLKAIGATRRQMKRVIWQEGMSLAVIGVPVGTILGYAIAAIAFPLLMRLGVWREGIEEVSIFSLPLLLTAAALAFLTVWTALRKPMKIVASISPIEAMRYQESSRRGRGIRKGKKELSVISMTLANLSGNRRRTVTTIVSMGLSCVLFILAANFMGNMDAEFDARTYYVEYGQLKVKLKFSMNDTAYPENNLDNILISNPFSKEVMEQIKDINGVTDVKTRKRLYAELTDKSGKKTGEKVSVAVLDQEEFDKIYSARGGLGKFDYESTDKERGIINGWGNFLEETGYDIGDTMNMKIADGDQEISFQAPLLGSFGSLEGDYAITEETCEALNLSGNMTETVWVDCADNDVNAVESALTEIFMGNRHVEMFSFQNALDESKRGMFMLRTVFYTFSILIAIISFLNMANTIIVSMVTRKQEFGVLQAIGMTNRQLNKSLQLEGMFFTLGTVFISALVGCPLGYLIFRYGKANGWIGLHIYHFPWLEIFLMIGCIALLQMVLSFILSRNVKKESLVERIRFQE